MQASQDTPALYSLSTCHGSRLLPATTITALVLAPVQVYVHCSILSVENDLLYTTWAEEGGSGQPLAFVVGKGCRAPRAWELAVLGTSRGSAYEASNVPSPSTACGYTLQWNCQNGTYASRQKAAYITAPTAQAHCLPCIAALRAPPHTEQ